MTIKTLRANGALQENGADVVVVGPTPVGDSSNATYLDFQEGSAASTVELPDLTGYELGDPIALHMVVQVFADADFEGEAEVFIALDDSLTNVEIGGFSTGAGGGFAFGLGAEALDAPHEYVVSLALGAWGNDSPSDPGGPTTVADIVAALEAGAFLDFNAFSWLDGDDPPTFRVYEAWIEVGSDLDPAVCVTEDFEGGTDGAVITPANTIFGEVSLAPTFTDEFAHSGSLSGTSDLLSAVSYPWSDPGVSIEEPAHGDFWFRWNGGVSTGQESGFFALYVTTGVGDDYAAVGIPAIEFGQYPDGNIAVRHHGPDDEISEEICTIPDGEWLNFTWTWEPGLVSWSITDASDAVLNNFDGAVVQGAAFGFTQYLLNDSGGLKNWLDDVTVCMAVPEAPTPSGEGDHVSRRHFFPT